MFASFDYLVPVDTAILAVPGLLHSEEALLAVLLVVGEVTTLVHSVCVGRRADVVGHQVILLKLVIQVGDLVISLPVDETPLICLIDVASLSQQPSPELDPNDAKDEEDEEAEKEDITKHGQRVQQQHHENSHA